MFVCKAKTIEVLVACDFELQQSGEPPSSQFQMKIKDNIYIKGLRRMIEDRIGMSSLTIMIVGCDGDDRMLCELVRNNPDRYLQNGSFMYSCSKSGKG